MFSILLLYYILSINSLNRIVIRGSKFFDEVTGNQFYIKGVAYQPKYPDVKIQDPLARPQDCARDLELFKELKLNVIRVYEVDPEQNHDECMKLFSDAGIYLILDLPIPQFSINRENPIYDLEILNHYTRNVDAFINYDNILAFFAGNEINNEIGNTDANPFVKAVLRDIKAYIRATSDKYVYVGYANNDDDNIRKNIQTYFNCGPEEERADFYGLNTYSWCGKSSLKLSKMDERIQELSDYSIPSFLSEYGCNSVLPRTFEIVDSLYGEKMSNTISGGIVFEYSQEANGYGLVKIENGKISKLPDFDYLKDKLSSVSPKTTDMNSYNPLLSKTLQCPQGSNWNSSNMLPQTPSIGACDCMMSSLECSLKDFDGITDEEIKSQFSFLCGYENVCNSFMQNGKTGEYGMWSTCYPKQKLSFAKNQFYINKKGECSGLFQKVIPTTKGVKKCEDVKPDLAEIGKRNGVNRKKNGVKNSSAISFNYSTLFVTLITSFVSIFDL